MKANETIAVSIALAIGIAISLTLYVVSARADREQKFSEFSLLAQARYSAIEQQLRNSELAVAGTAALFESSVEVSLQEFTTFTRTMRRRNPAMESLQWAPRVRHDEVESFQRDARRQQPAFSIRSFPPGTGNTDEQAAEELFPVLYSHPASSHLSSPGVDLSSHPALQQAIYACIEVGQLQASRPIEDTRTHNESSGLVLVHPVFDGPIRTRPERMEYAAGVVVASLRLKGLMDATLYSLKQFNSGLVSVIYDVDHGQRSLIYGTREPEGSNVPAELRLEQPLTLGGRQWLVVSTVRSDSRLLHSSTRAITLLICGLLATLFAVAYLFSSAGKSRKVRELVAQQTRDLQRTQRYNDAILHTSSDSTILLDQDLLITRVNSAAGRLFGMSEEKLVGMSVTELMPELPNRLSEPSGFEIQGINAAGFPLDLRTWISENQVEDDYFRVLVLHDVTEQRVVENSVRDQRNLMQAILDSMTEALVLVDHRRRLQIVNRAGRELLGQNFSVPEPSDLANDQGFCNIENETPMSARELPLNRALAGEHVSPKELVLKNELHPKGIRLEATAVQVQRGPHAGALMVASDVTERTLAQARLADYARKLEISNRELDQFSRAASHDLQEPLRKVERFGSLLLDMNTDKLDEQSLDFLQRMISAASRMSDMIEALLTLSRINTRSSNFSPCDLNRIAEVAVDNLQIRIEDTKASIEVEPLPEVDADPVQMEQLFTNLLGNGLKYVQPGDRPRLQLQVKAAEQPTHCLLVFRDHGIGFPAEKAEKLFEVFSRLVRREQYAGSGVGLSICKRIVERHGGRIWAESNPGEGSSFYVQLPMRQASHEAD